MMHPNTQHQKPPLPSARDAARGNTGIAASLVGGLIETVGQIGFSELPRKNDVIQHLREAARLLEEGQTGEAF